MRELERRVEELESYKESMELESAKPQDATERTSGNYGPNKTGNNAKKPPSNKRKARDKDKIGAENGKIRLTDSTTDNISVSVSDKDVLIEMQCSCKENALVEVMGAVHKLHLDTQNVQSSTINGILSMTINAKVVLVSCIWKFDMHACFRFMHDMQLCTNSWYVICSARD